MKKLLITLLLILGLPLLAGMLWLRVTAVQSTDLPALRSGDLVFQTTVFASQSAAIMLATQSLYSHMGIIKQQEDGSLHVVEAIGPVREISLDDWIAQGVGGRITVKRRHGLTPAQAQAVLDYTKSRYGLPYDFYFTFGDDALYCSELAYKAFASAGAAVGSVQKIGDLGVDNETVRDLMRRRAGQYPPCVEAGASDFQSCLPVMLQQPLITPRAMAEDPALEMIFSNYPF